jgi:dTMP kinase
VAYGLHPETEALLMFGARREHLDKVIVPALEAGTWVICDRFTDATYAYQSGGSGIPWGRIGVLEQWVQQGLQPDVTICFDVAPEVGRGRSGRIHSPDRFEQEQNDFFRRVREAYHRRAREHPERINVVDASAGIPEFQKELEVIILTICK